jgi:hypothetical protein
MSHYKQHKQCTLSLHTTALLRFLKKSLHIIECTYYVCFCHLFSSISQKYTLISYQYTTVALECTSQNPLHI